MHEPTKQRKSRNPDTTDADLEWFLVAGSSAMRERGTLGAVTNVLELGGASGGVPNVDLYTDAQVGFGKHPIGDVERHRWLSAAWHRLDPRTQAVLIARYIAPPAELVLSPPPLKRGSKPQTPPAIRGDSNTRTSVESNLGEWSSLALWLAKDPAKLLTACLEPDKNGGRAYCRKAVRTAREAATDAHAAWREAKTGKPRKKADRVAILPAYVPEVNR